MAVDGTGRPKKWLPESSSLLRRAEIQREIVSRLRNFLTGCFSRGFDSFCRTFRHSPSFRELLLSQDSFKENLSICSGLLLIYACFDFPQSKKVQCCRHLDLVSCLQLIYCRLTNVLPIVSELLPPIAGDSERGNLAAPALAVAICSCVISRERLFILVAARLSPPAAAASDHM